MTPKLLVATFKRYLWEQRNLLVVIGNTDKITEGREAYQERWSVPPYNNKQNALVDRLLGATGLAAISLAERESWGWSFTMPGSTLGFFVGVEPEGMICARITEAEPEADGAIVQRQKAGELLKQSHFKTTSLDPTLVVERYFEDVDQIQTRVGVTSGGICALVQSMPGGKMDDLQNDDAETLVRKLTQEAAAGTFKTLQEVLVFYECRCNENQINEMIAKLPEDKRKEIWGDLLKLEVDCPRCGRQYVVHKKNPATKVH